MANVKDAVNIINKFLEYKSINKKEAKVKGVNIWVIEENSLNYQIAIGSTDYEKQVENVVSISTYLMPMPEHPNTRYKLLDEILHINASMPLCRFAIIENQITIISLRMIENLDLNELKLMIQKLSEYGNKYKKIFKKRYNE